MSPSPSEREGFIDLDGANTASHFGKAVSNPMLSFAPCSDRRSCRDGHGMILGSATSLKLKLLSSLVNLPVSSDSKSLRVTGTRHFWMG